MNIEEQSVKDKNFEQTLIDELDRKILKLLLENSRLSYRRIASKLKISTATVINRIQRLKKSGVIKRYTTMLDHEKLGYELSVVIEITVSKGKLLEVEKTIAKHPNVCAVYDVTGLTDAMIIAKFKSRKELNSFVKRLLSMEYVERTNTHLVLNTVKEDFRIV
ncbi:MAG: Lrp/AsnC family transcriptional regulator [Candidatus Aenigmarchaeota archaeon]|nr:Lrp/AsnC family transcriptional regulator [Candidatus Aenigmarchaeota archaeon]